MAAAFDAMEFGIFDQNDHGPYPLAEQYENRLKLVSFYDRAGFRTYHMSEHHSTPLNLAPSPSVFLAAIAQRTERLRLGPLVYVLPTHHPLRLAEEICMLDHLSRGRLEVGIGRGASPHELAYFGVDPETAPAMYVEAYQVMMQALTRDEHAPHSGKARHDRGCAIDLRRTDRGRDVVAIDRNPALLEVERGALADGRHGILVVQSDAVVDRLPGDGAVHRAGVHMPVPEPRRNRALHRPQERPVWGPPGSASSMRCPGSKASACPKPNARRSLCSPSKARPARLSATI